jgi:hypothetical protein
MNMNVLKEEKNRGYVIAGIAAIIAFISFFLPYYSVSAGIFGSFSASAAQIGGYLWLVFILILVSIALPALLMFRANTASPFGVSGMPYANQVRYAAYGLIGTGALSVLLLLLSILTGTGGIGFGGSEGGVSAGPAFGFWLLLLAMIAVAVGGFLAMRTAATAPTSQAFPPSQQWPSVQPPQPQWQQQQYPPQQWPSQQEPTQYAPPPQYGQQSQYGQPAQQYPPSQQYPPQYPPAQQPWAQPQPSEQQWPPTQQQQPPSQQPPS